MDAASVKAAYEQAQGLVAEVREEPYHSIAFEVVFRRLLEGAGAFPVPSGGREPVSARPEIARVAMGEFLANTRASSYPDRLIAIACYHLYARNDESVTRAEILDTFSKARIPKPKNLSDVIAQCVRKGHLMDAAEPKDGQRAWQVTQTGERYFRDSLVAGES